VAATGANVRISDSAEWVQFATIYKEWKIVGTKMEYLPLGINDSAASINSVMTGSFNGIAA